MRAFAIIVVVAATATGGAALAQTTTPERRCSHSGPSTPLTPPPHLRPPCTPARRTVNGLLRSPAAY